MSDGHGPEEILLYKMSQIPGTDLSSYFRANYGTDHIPSIAGSLGTILANAIVPEATVDQMMARHGGEQMQGLSFLEKTLEVAYQAQKRQNSDLAPILESLLSRLHSSPELQHLPLTISNGDISPTNILIQDNTISGIVDWEDITLMPLGFDTEAIFWLIGIINVQKETPLNTADIEQSFWSSFSSSLPSNLRTQHSAIELALHIAAALRACPGEHVNEWLAVSLPKMMEYRIPLQHWSTS